METVRTLPRPVGRVRLAHILRGARAQDLLRMGYHRHKFYGKLSHLSQEDIVAVIDTLVGRRYLALSSDRRPVLTLMPAGLTALKLRAAIPLPVRAPAPQNSTVERWRKRAPRSETRVETLALFRQGLSPDEIAKARELTVRTIYTHLARLIADREIELEKVVSADVIARVRAVVEDIGAERLTPIKERLPETISYDEIRCVIAGLGLERRTR
jgi:uncharacterized protein YpbB